METETEDATNFTEEDWSVIEDIAEIETAFDEMSLAGLVSLARTLCPLRLAEHAGSSREDVRNIIYMSCTHAEILAVLRG